MIESIKQNQRVLLRYPTYEDCDQFIECALRSKSLHKPWVYPPVDKDSYLHYLDRCKAENFIGLLVLNKPQLEFAGVINISEIVRGAFQSAYLGFYGFYPMTGKGYFNSALKLAIRYCFQDLRLHRLEANIQPANARSIRLVQNCGFKKEGFSPSYLKVGGQWRDHERWAILNQR